MWSLKVTVKIDNDATALIAEPTAVRIRIAKQNTMKVLPSGRSSTNLDKYKW